jgi:hypothetical protein
LLDAKTGEPIVFASVYLKDRKMGVISNLDGGFRIPTFYRDTGDILVISSMGYQRKEFLVYDLAIYKMNLIRLEPAIFELAEAFVTAKPKRELRSATRIVRKAIKAIPQNYAQHTFSTVGYYRDYQRENEQYVNLNEAILEVFDSGFGQTDYKASKVRLYEYKPNNGFKRDKVSDRPYDYINNTKTVPRAYLPSYGGNEFVILRVHDAIRNYKINSYDFINRLEIDFIDNHIFRKLEDTYVDGEHVYTVKLTKRLPNYRINGTLYISKQNFAIFKFEYAIRRILTGAAKNKRKVNSEILFEVVNEYKPKYGKMYLNYISFHNIFQLAQPPELIVKEVIADRRRRFFEVRLNKKVDPVFSIKRSNYKFRYLGERVKFKNVVVLDDKVRLYPNLDAYEIDSMFALINDALQNHETLTGLFDTQIKGLRTVNADGEFIRLNERKLKSYHQFREFFVQEVKPNAKLVQDSLYMNKLQPIFKDQPFVKPDNFGDYWMNTPLKTVQE